MTEQNIGSLTISQFKNICEDFFQFPLDNETNLNNIIQPLSTTDFKVWLDNISTGYRHICFTPILKWIAEIRGNYNPLTASASEFDPIDSKQNQYILKTYRDIFDTAFEEKIATLPIVAQKKKEWFEFYQAELKDKSLNIEVDKQTFKAISVCDVFWSGWECDSKAWVVVDNGVKKLVTSNHGTLRFTDASFLEDKISEYKKAIAESEEILKFLA